MKVWASATTTFCSAPRSFRILENSRAPPVRPGLSTISVALLEVVGHEAARAPGARWKE
jgi:hypothetical protein